MKFLIVVVWLLSMALGLVECGPGATSWIGRSIDQEGLVILAITVEKWNVLK
jgi:hypothetical protein